MVRIDIEYRGDLRCRAVHAPSGNELFTDAPVDNRGRGESFSPTDLAATALGACMLTVMGIAAADRGWDLSGARVSVVKSMVADPGRRIGRLEVTISVPGELDAEQRTELERAAHGCPVCRSLSEAVERAVTFRWGAAATSA